MNRDMNQNNQNDQRNRRDRRPEREQQPSRGPEMEGPPMTPPPNFIPPGPGGPFGPGGPGLPGGPGGPGGPPRMAPPSFIPEPLGMERRFPRGRGPGFEFIIPEHQVGRSDLRRCLNRFTFIWLRNGNSFWFYPTFIDRQFVQGFRWRRNRWEYDFINLNRIIFFRCF